MIPEIKYCDGCTNLSISEDRQNILRYRTGKVEEHFCTKYNKRVLHFEYHPKILRLTECDSYNNPNISVNNMEDTCIMNNEKQMQLTKVIRVNDTELETAQALFNAFKEGKRELDLGSFKTNLYQAIKFADRNNIYKLARAYPSDILASLIWKHGENYDYFRDFYKLDFIIERSTVYIHSNMLNIKKLEENIENTWNSMVLNKEDKGIVEFIVDNAAGIYILKEFGEMFNIVDLQRDPYETEGYWDDWSYKINSQCDNDITAILNLDGFLKKFPDDMTIGFDFNEGGGDLALMLSVPEDYWDNKEIEE